jgi:aspartate aminotransferase
VPAHPALAEQLASATDRTAYPPVLGEEQARVACAGYFRRRGMAAEPDRVVLAPGSKALLYASLLAVPGDVVVPVPSWVSYAAQVELTGKRVIGVPVPADTGGIPDPNALEDVLVREAKRGRKPGLVVLTRPDNPTGTIAPESDIRAICELAEAHDLHILSDEIYGDLVHTGQGATDYAVSPSVFLPRRTIVTTGLSKRLALGGWRIGFGLLPEPDPGDATTRSLASDLTGIASEIWSALPGPMQDVVTLAADEPPELRAHIADARRLHGSVSHAMWRVFRDTGIECREPQGGFYLYPDFEPHRERLAAASVTTSTRLAEVLLESHGIGVLPGEAFGDKDSRLTVRVATSLLYGKDREQRQAALDSADPVRLPWIEAALHRVRDELAGLCG